MALSNLIDTFQKQKKVDNLKFIFRSPLKKRDDEFFQSVGDVVTVDATLKEQYTLESNITNNEIESGFTLTDHIHILPRKLSITGAISQAPTSVVSTVIKKSAQFSINSVSENFLPSNLDNFQKRISIAGTGYLSEKFLGTKRGNIQKVYWPNFLKARFLEAKEFEIVSSVDSIENCFFESITWNREYRHGESLIFDAVIKEIRVVNDNFRPFTENSVFAQPTKNLGHTLTEQLTSGSPAYNAVLNALPSGIAEPVSSVINTVENNLSKIKKGLSIFGF